MKINDTARLSQLQAYKNANRTRDKQGADSSSEAVRDGVSISQQAIDLARVSHTDGAERAERMAAVKQQIQDGTYHVEANAVVRKMLDAYGEL